ALNVLEGHAAFSRPRRDVRLRVAGHEGRIYLDLADGAWSAVEIGPGGWRVRMDLADTPEDERLPVRFRPPKGALPIPEPQPGGTLDELRTFLNVASEADWLLIQGWLFGAIRPTGPYPVLALAGEQGSAKTTAGRVLRRLIDPARAMLRSD